MSLVHFIPRKDTEYFEGWPCHVVGDGFINLELVEWAIEIQTIVLCTKINLEMNINLRECLMVTGMLK